MAYRKQNMQGWQRSSVVEALHSAPASQECIQQVLQKGFLHSTAFDYCLDLVWSSSIALAYHGLALLTIGMRE